MNRRDLLLGTTSLLVAGLPVEAQAAPNPAEQPVPSMPTWPRMMSRMVLEPWNEDEHPMNWDGRAMRDWCWRLVGQAQTALAEFRKQLSYYPDHTYGEHILVFFERKDGSEWPREMRLSVLSEEFLGKGRSEMILRAFHLAEAAVFYPDGCLDYSSLLSPPDVRQECMVQLHSMRLEFQMVRRA